MKKIPIKFDDKGKFVSVDKRFLKKHVDYGYYLIFNGLIHFFDRNKRYERSKIYVGR